MEGPYWPQISRVSALRQQTTDHDAKQNWTRVAKIIELSWSQWDPGVRRAPLLGRLLCLLRTELKLDKVGVIQNLSDNERDIRAWSLLPILRRYKDPDQVHWQRLNGKMNDEGVIHLNPEWGLREPQSACVILSHQMRVFSSYNCLCNCPLGIPHSRVSAPGFLAWVKDWQLTNYSLRAGTGTTPGVRASQSEARDLEAGPMRSEDRLLADDCQGLLKHGSCQWVNQGNHFYYHLVYLANSRGSGTKKLRKVLDLCLLNKGVQMSCWV